MYKYKKKNMQLYNMQGMDFLCVFPNIKENHQVEFSYLNCYSGHVVYIALRMSRNIFNHKILKKYV